MKHYIGLDAHSKTCTFVVINQEGQEDFAACIPTSEKELIKVVRSVPKPRALVFEEMHLSKWLYSLLRCEVDELIVCNPRFVCKRPGSKDDYQDARHLAQQLRGNFLIPVYHDEGYLFELRSLVSAYQDLICELTQAKNRYKAIFLTEAHLTTGSRIYRDESRILMLSRSTDQFVAKALFDQIQSLRCLCKNYLSKFRKIAKETPEINALTTIPGIADVRACTIAA